MRASWRADLTLHVADQAASSLTNFLATILAARALSTSDLGAFGLAMLYYGVTLAFARAASSDVFVLDSRSADPRFFSAPLSAAIYCGMCAGTLALVAQFALPDLLPETGLILWFLMPVLMAQDAMRFIAFRMGRPLVAIGSDAAWGALLFVAFILDDAPPTVARLLTLWTIAGTISALLPAVRLKLRLTTVRAAADWLRPRWTEVRAFLADTVLRSGPLLLGPLLLVALSSQTSLGQLRAGETIFSPASTAFLLATSTLVGYLSDAGRAGRDALDRRIALLAGLLVMLCGGIAATTMLLPEHVGITLLGQNWKPAAAIALPLGLTYAAGAIGLAYSTALRVVGRIGDVVRIRTYCAVPTLVSVAIGAWTAGTTGYVVALSASSAVIAGLVIFSYRADPTPQDAPRQDQTNSAAVADAAPFQTTDSVVNRDL